MATANKSNPLISNESTLIESLEKENGYAWLRRDAYALWKNCPAPTTRDEYWKYTRLGPILNKSYEISSVSKSFDASLLRGIDAYNLVFVNGLFSADHSDVLNKDDVIIADLNSLKSQKLPIIEALMGRIVEENDYFSLLNSAFHQNGPFVWIGKNTVLDKPVRIAHVITDKERMINIKGFVSVEKAGQVKIIESWDNEGASDNLMNSRMDYNLHENARIELIKIQSAGSSNALISQDFVNQEANSFFRAGTISIDGKMIRNNMNTVLNGEGSSCNLSGLYMLKGEEHVDNHTLITHAVPHCESRELYKGILNEKSKGVFNGKVIVSRDAQKTNAFQYNGNLLLTDDAQVYSKPELEIYADDVKCSHGSTTGQLDEEAMFYLQSRGIGKDKAKNLLLYAFAREVLDEISIPEIRERIDHYISSRYHTNDYA
jgi:Fe-S cluster assembly protein SufD